MRLNKIILHVIIIIFCSDSLYAQNNRLTEYSYEWKHNYYGINYFIRDCEQWISSASSMPRSVFTIRKSTSLLNSRMTGSDFQRSPNTKKGYCGVCEGNPETTGYGSRYKSCLSFFTYNFHCEDMIPFDCRNEGVMRVPIYISWFGVYIACSGFYYLDTAQHYKVYQFEYYKEKALNPKKKEMVLKMDFCPKIGVIRQQAFKERAEAKNYRKYPSLQKVRLSFGKPRRLFDMHLSTINNLPLSQIIQKDTCFTPFCDIDKVGCE